MPPLVVKPFITYIAAFCICGKELKVDEKQHAATLNRI